MIFESLELPWLLRAPSDFRARCRALGSGSEPLGPEVQKLAGFALAEPDAMALGKAIGRLRAEGADLAPMSELRLAILSNSTFDFIGATLPAAAARHGVALDVWTAPLDQVEQLAFDPVSELYGSKRDAVLLGIDHRWLRLEFAGFEGDPEARVSAAVARLQSVVSAIGGASNATVIVPTIAAPPVTLFGSFERRTASSTAAMVDQVNARLPALCAETGAVLLDVEGLAAAVWTSRWFDARAYNLYKLPFLPEANPLYCDHVGRLLAALRGKSRKCLVLDLDNTCWGGVIGDDGLEGICISGAEGEAFLSVQRLALDLKARGVILAVSSKNDDDNARRPFREHPDMLLKEADIAVFQANWNDKPSNLEAIARTLDIGLDSLVFLDDNGAERAMMRAALPMVATPELPTEPALYAQTLAAAGYFEAVSFSDEDRHRSESYAANAQRAEVLSRSSNLEDYLASLEMRIGFAPFDDVNRARIAQLINKTNQFNLTTRRYTENQVAVMEREAPFTLQVRLSDSYGDFGMIGVVIVKAHAEPASWDIDTWLMSCRVLGRQVEEAMLDQVVAAARQAGVSTLFAQYIPTAKNGMVADLYDKLGFDRTDGAQDGVKLYRLDVSRYVHRPLPFSGWPSIDV